MWREPSGKLFFEHGDADRLHSARLAPELAGMSVSIPFMCSDLSVSVDVFIVVVEALGGRWMSDPGNADVVVATDMSDEDQVQHLPKRVTVVDESWLVRKLAAGWEMRDECR